MFPLTSSPADRPMSGIYEARHMIKEMSMKCISCDYEVTGSSLLSIEEVQEVGTCLVMPTSLEKFKHEIF